MVDMQTIQANRSYYVIEEQALVAKTGNPENNEDFIHTSPFFVAVIDGTTSKTARRWEEKTGGQVCAHIIDQVLSQLSSDVTVRAAVDTITAHIKDFYKEQGVLELVQKDPSQRVTAALIVASLPRREIWFIGDCQCMLDDRLLQNTKPVDDITAQARAMFLETELQKGATIEELRQNDTGREFILPLLKQQQLFQNNPAAGTYWYPIIDGFPVPAEGVRIESIPEKTQTIVLASDGYPVLKSSLEASEEELQDVLERDPLLFRFYKSTKGVQEGYVSYDDRAYIKLRLIHEGKEQTAVTARGNGFGKPAKKLQKKRKLRKQGQ
jgi:glycerophosphoryl diester phosphodiesterase